MTISFDKYQGAGNDFVVVDGRRPGPDPGDADLIRRLCDRRFGIGADGLIVLAPCDVADYEMLYFNADGRPGTMCGNGGRCAAHCALRWKIAGPKQRFLACDGLHEAEVAGDAVRLGLADVRGHRIIEGGYFLDTGSPHYVIFAPGIDGLDVAGEGRRWRLSPLFAPGGTNVDFVERTPGGLSVRTYERGVEAETWACGTGVTAAAIALALKEGSGGPVEVRARGGLLKVEFDIRGDLVTGIRLTGPATFVFSGSIEA